MAILESKAKSDDVLRSHVETGHRNQQYMPKTERRHQHQCRCHEEKTAATVEA